MSPCKINILSEVELFSLKPLLNTMSMYVIHRTNHANPAVHIVYIYIYIYIYCPCTLSDNLCRQPRFNFTERSKYLIEGGGADRHLHGELKLSAV